MNILNQIIENKKQEIQARKQKLSFSDLQIKLKEKEIISQKSFLKSIKIKSLESEVRTTTDKLENTDIVSNEKKINIIAEIKKASPSKGVINEDIDVVNIARIYEQTGAAAISVLTDYKYFKGKLEYLEAISKAVSIPCLCKDFIIDEYQIYEAKLYGADAFLIIAKALERETIKEFLEIAQELDLDVLVEVHDKEDIEKIKDLDVKIVGINNRSLEDMSIDITNAVNLINCLPRHVVKISESGIYTRQDVDMMEKSGFDAVLVGSSIMESGDVEGKMKELL